MMLRLAASICGKTRANSMEGLSEAVRNGVWFPITVRGIAATSPLMPPPPESLGEERTTVRYTDINWLLLEGLPILASTTGTARRAPRAIWRPEVMYPLLGTSPRADPYPAAPWVGELQRPVSWALREWH